MATFSITWDLVQYSEILPERKKYMGNTGGRVGGKEQKNQVDGFIEPVSVSLQAEF